MMDYIVYYFGGGTAAGKSGHGDCRARPVAETPGRDACRHGRRAAADLPRALAHSSAEAAGVYDDDRDNVGSSSGAATLTPYTSLTPNSHFFAF